MGFNLFTSGVRRWIWPNRSITNP